MSARFGPTLVALLIAVPVTAGLAGTVLPAFGMLPSLGSTRPSLDPFRELAAEPGLLRSTTLGLAAGLISAFVALATVFLFASGWIGTGPFRRITRLVSPLLAVPHAAAAFGFAFLIAPSGLVARLVSPQLTGWDQPPDWLIVNDPCALSLALGLAAKEVPFLFLMTLAALPQTGHEQARRLAASLGYGRVTGFLHAVWPPLYRQIRLPVFAVIAFATSVVDVAAILGPSTPPVLAVRLVTWMNDPELAMRLKASAGALLQLGVSAAAIILWIGLEKVGSVLRRVLCMAGLRLRRDGIWRAAGFAAMSGFAGLLLAGLLALALWSVASFWQFPDALPASFTLAGWRSSFSRLADPLWRTIVVAAASAGAALLLVVFALLGEEEAGDGPGPRSRWSLYLPLIVPQIAFLFGIQTALLVAGLAPSTPLLVGVHLIFVLPYVMLALADTWWAFDRRYEAVAFGLGRGRLRVLVSVRLPMLASPLMTAFAVGFAVSVGLYLPTLLIGAGRLPTVTTEAVALAAGGNRRIIGVWAFAQAILPAIGFAIAATAPCLLYRCRRTAA